MGVQSVLFKKADYSLSEAIKKLLEMGFDFTKVDETTNYYRFRQYDPIENAKYTIKNSSSERGVKFVISF